MNIGNVLGTRSGAFVLDEAASVNDCDANTFKFANDA